MPIDYDNLLNYVPSIQLQVPIAERDKTYVAPSQQQQYAEFMAQKMKEDEAIRNNPDAIAERVRQIQANLQHDMNLAYSRYYDPNNTALYDAIVKELQDNAERDLNAIPGYAEYKAGIGAPTIGPAYQTDNYQISDDQVQRNYNMVNYARNSFSNIGSGAYYMPVDYRNQNAVSSYVNNAKVQANFINDALATAGIGYGINNIGKLGTWTAKGIQQAGRLFTPSEYIPGINYYGRLIRPGWRGLSTNVGRWVDGLTFSTIAGLTTQNAINNPSVENITYAGLSYLPFFPVGIEAYNGIRNGINYISDNGIPLSRNASWYRKVPINENWYYRQGTGLAQDAAESGVIRAGKDPLTGRQSFSYPYFNKGRLHYGKNSMYNETIVNRGQGNYEWATLNGVNEIEPTGYTLVHDASGNLIPVDFGFRTPLVNGKANLASASDFTVFKPFKLFGKNFGYVETPIVGNNTNVPFTNLQTYLNNISKVDYYPSSNELQYLTNLLNNDSSILRDVNFDYEHLPLQVRKILGDVVSKDGVNTGWIFNSNTKTFYKLNPTDMSDLQIKMQMPNALDNIIDYKLNPERLKVTQETMGWNDNALNEYMQELSTLLNPRKVHLEIGNSLENPSIPMGTAAGKIVGNSPEWDIMVNRAVSGDPQMLFETYAHEIGGHLATGSVASDRPKLMQLFPRTYEVIQHNNQLLKNTLQPNDFANRVRMPIYEQVQDLQKRGLTDDQIEDLIPIMKADQERLNYRISEQEGQARVHTANMSDQAFPGTVSQNENQLRHYFSPESIERLKKLILSVFPVLPISTVNNDK